MSIYARNLCSQRNTISDIWFLTSHCLKLCYWSLLMGWLVCLFPFVTGLTICSWYCGPERFWTNPSTTARQHTWKWRSYEDCLLSEKQPASGEGPFLCLSKFFKLERINNALDAYWFLPRNVMGIVGILVQILQNHKNCWGWKGPEKGPSHAWCGCSLFSALSAQCLNIWQMYFHYMR